MTSSDRPGGENIALVTGASSGIGAATAARLAERGARVIVGFNANADAAATIVKTLPGEGHMAMRVSIGEADSIAAAAAEVEHRFGRLDVLVNSAGFTTPVPLGDLDGLTDEIFDEVVKVNLRGPFALVRAFRHLLEAPESSVVINVSSIAARTGVGSSHAYLAAKAGTDSLTVSLAKVLGPKVRVLAVAPAAVDTDFVKGRPRERILELAESTPLKHLTTADNVARAVMACVHDLTSSTGIVLPVDEGRHL